MVNDDAVGIIQARLASTRLPGKILAPIAGRTVLLDVLVQRLRSSGIDWWLATTDLPSDDVTAAWGEALGLQVFRGSEQDVLSRFTGVIELTGADVVVRVTADNPFTDGGTVRRLLELLRGADDTITGIRGSGAPRQFPLGFVPEVVRSSALLELDSAIVDDGSVHRTHVTSAIDQGAFLTYRDDALPSRARWRWTVDTATDLAMAREAFGVAGSDWADLDYAGFVAALDERPDITSMNQGVQQKALEDG